MPGRKQPPMSEAEKKREYRLFNKRGGEETPTSGAPAEIQEERDEWARGRTKKT